MSASLSGHRPGRHVAFRIGARKIAVLTYMASDPFPRSTAYIATKVGLTKRAAANTMYQLGRSKLVDPVLPAKWKINRDGLAVIEILAYPVPGARRVDGA